MSIILVLACLFTGHFLLAGLLILIFIALGV